MKSVIKFTMVILFMSVSSIILAQSNQYVLNGKVGHLQAPAKAYLMRSSEAGQQIDSTVIKDGSFTFNGTITNPSESWILVNGKGTGLYSRKDLSSISIYLEQGVMTMTSPDSLINAKFTSGQINMDNSRLSAMLKPVKSKMSALRKEYKETPEEKSKLKSFSDEMEKRAGVLEKEQKEIYLAFIKDNPSSMVSLFTLKLVGGGFPDVAEMEPLFTALSDNVKSSKLGVDYQANLSRLKQLSIGGTAPDFTQPDTSGKAVSLHDFKGKYVLVDFWASWCVPCRAENPNVIKAYDTYKSKNFTVLSISLDKLSDRAKWLKAIHDDHLSWTQVSDLTGGKNMAAALYVIQAIPQNFLIGPDGIIIAKNLRGEELDKTLSKILK